MVAHQETLTERLQGADDNRVFLALTRLPSGRMPDAHGPIWGEVLGRSAPALRRAITAACLRRLSPQGLASFFLKHPLLQVRQRITRGHCDRVYKTPREEALREATDFYGYREALSPVLRFNAELMREFELATDLLWRSFRASEALPFYRWLLDFDPGQASAHFYLGQIHATQGQDEEALAAFFRYLESAPADRPDNAYFLDAYVLETHAYHPSAQEAYARIAAIYRRRGDMDRSRRAFGRSIGRNQGHHQAPNFELARLLMEDFGDPRAAFQQLLKAEAITAKKTRYFYGSDGSPSEDYVALAESMADDYPMLSGSNQTRSNHVMALHLEIARALRKAGDHDEALAIYGHLGSLEKRRWRKQSLPVLEGKLEIVAELYRDWIQVEHLCQEILQRQAEHAMAQAYAEKARRALRRL